MAQHPARRATASGGPWTLAPHPCDLALVAGSVTLLLGLGYGVWRRGAGAPDGAAGRDRRWRAYLRSPHLGVLAAVWATLEATGWWVFPDLLPGLAVGARSPRRALLLGHLAGGIAGSVLAYALGRALGTRRVAYLERIPFIHPDMIEQVADWYRAFGAAGVLCQPLSGVPYKVFALLAPAHGVSLRALLLVGVPARQARYLAVSALAAGVERVAGRALDRHRVPATAALLVVFTGVLRRTADRYAAGPRADDPVARLLACWRR